MEIKTSTTSKVPQEKDKSGSTKEFVAKMNSKNSNSKMKKVKQKSKDKEIDLQTISNQEGKISK